MKLRVSERESCHASEKQLVIFSFGPHAGGTLRPDPSYTTGAQAHRRGKAKGTGDIHTERQQKTRVCVMRRKMCELCVTGCGRKAYDMYVHASPRAAKSLPCTAKIIEDVSRGTASRAEQHKDKRRWQGRRRRSAQQYHLGELLADELVADEPARGSDPSRALLIICVMLRCALSVSCLPVREPHTRRSSRRRRHRHSGYAGHYCRRCCRHGHRQGGVRAATGNH